MKLLEASAKQILQSSGLTVPRGSVVTTSKEAFHVCGSIGPCVVKAQIAAGGRAKAGGVIMASDASAARAAADRLLGSEIGGHRVESVLVEEQISIDRELYVGLSINTSIGCPILMVSPHGGIDVEDDPQSFTTVPLDPGGALSYQAMDEVIEALDHDSQLLRAVISDLYRMFTQLKAVLVEVNPLVLTTDGAFLALDAKVETDDAADPPGFGGDLSRNGAGTALETEAADRGLRMIELGGSVAILANGAGLTMTTMDAVAHHGGQPANFLEIGGDAYTLAETALELILRQTGVRSLIVNFCGAFARCDVMTEGVLNALGSLKPTIPVFFSIHGTGQDEARDMVRSRLGTEPFDAMDDAVIAAVEAAR